MFSQILNFDARKIFLAALLALSCASAALAQTTTFTYQGRLTDSGTPANGNYDLQFALFDSLSGGTQIGSTQTLSTVSISSGAFTVQLDFGAAAFPGANRFLEISVRLAGGGSFTTLSPRQQITSAPYAIRSKSTDMATTADGLSSACVGCVSTRQGGTGLSSSGPAGNVLKSNGTIWIGGPIGPPDIGGFGPAGNFLKSNGAAWTSAPIAPADIPAGSGNYIQNTAALQAGAADFNISGNGTAGGTLSGNIVNATTQYNIGGSSVLRSTPLGPTGADGNTIVGINAGINAVSSRNTFVGTSAGASPNNTGHDNSFFGLNAGGSNTTGSNNSFFGTSVSGAAGGSNTTGSDNAFFGGAAGVNNIAGSNNAFFGSSAGFSNTASDNAFFGASAGSSNTIGVNNAFFGREAGRMNTTGHDNAFFGRGAGLSNDTGYLNAFFGTGAGNANTRSFHNAFFGSGAGFSNTMGIDNAFFGFNTGSANMTGTLNAFFGKDAGSSSTGNYNTFVGAIAGAGNTTGERNVFLGSNAGNGNVGGSNNTIIGAGADVIVGGLTNATAIGAGATVGTSSTMVLGASSGTTAVQVPGTLKLGTLGGEGTSQLCRTDSNLIGLCSSSLRYKTKVASFAGGLNIVNRLRPISFNWKTSGARDLGFGAEEVAAVEPLLVTHNDKGQIEGVKYDRISAVLVNAVKEQQNQIEILRAQNAALSARLQVVEKSLKRKTTPTKPRR